jgi:hypothetical protein
MPMTHPYIHISRPLASSERFAQKSAAVSALASAPYWSARAAQIVWNAQALLSAAVAGFLTSNLITA